MKTTKRSRLALLLFLGIVFQAMSETPVPDTAILGGGRLTNQDMAAFLVANNPDIDPSFARDFAALYAKEAVVEGVNHDIAFSQMCYETSFLKFDRMVKLDSNNFGGIGAVSAKNPGETFPSIHTGIRAHIQHLKAYATDASLVNALVDPRYYNVRSGSAATLGDLAGRWSSDRLYTENLLAVIDGAAGFASNGNALAAGNASR